MFANNGKCSLLLTVIVNHENCLVPHASQVSVRDSIRKSKKVVLFWPVGVWQVTSPTFKLRVI